MISAQDARTEEEARLEMHVQARLGRRVRDFRVERRDTGFVLRGRTSTYYAKQLVQHAVMRATPLPILANEIEVGPAGEGWRAGCG